MTHGSEKGVEVCILDQGEQPSKSGEVKKSENYCVKVSSDYQRGNDELLIYCSVFCTLRYSCYIRICVQVTVMYPYMSTSSSV